MASDEDNWDWDGDDWDRGDWGRVFSSESNNNKREPDTPAMPEREGSDDFLKRQRKTLPFVQAGGDMIEVPPKGGLESMSNIDALQYVCYQLKVPLELYELRSVRRPVVVRAPHDNFNSDFLRHGPCTLYPREGNEPWAPVAPVNDLSGEYVITSGLKIKEGQLPDYLKTRKYAKCTDQEPTRANDPVVRIDVTKIRTGEKKTFFLSKAEKKRPPGSPVDFFVAHPTKHVGEWVGNTTVRVMPRAAKQDLAYAYPYEKCADRARFKPGRIVALIVRNNVTMVVAEVKEGEKVIVWTVVANVEDDDAYEPFWPSPWRVEPSQYLKEDMVAVVVLGCCGVLLGQNSTPHSSDPLYATDDGYATSFQHEASRFLGKAGPILETLGEAKAMSCFTSLLGKLGDSENRVAKKTKNELNIIKMVNQPEGDQHVCANGMISVLVAFIIALVLFGHYAPAIFV